MWCVQRLCKLEVVLLSSMMFFFGATITYFTVHYAGYGVDKCRASPTLYYKDGELRWPRKVVKDKFPTPDPDRDKKCKDQGRYGGPASVVPRMQGGHALVRVWVLLYNVIIHDSWLAAPPYISIINTSFSAFKRRRFFKSSK